MYPLKVVLQQLGYKEAFSWNSATR